MNEQQLRQLLNQGIQVSPKVADRLRQARDARLGAPAPRAGAGPRLGRQRGGRHAAGAASRCASWCRSSCWPAAAAAIYQWQQNQRAAEVEEIDSMLLTDDLPIDAYLDRDFQNWLKKRAAEQ